MQRWDLPDLIAFLESIRNFQWIHVATESLLTSEIEPFAETNQNKGKKTRETASDLIRAVVKGERCKNIFFKKKYRQ